MTPDDFEEIRYEVAEGVAEVRLDAPERRNAWGGRMAVEYRWALHLANADPDARVVLVSSTSRDFSVGAHMEDLHTIAGNDGAYERVRVELPPHAEDAPPGLQHNHTYPQALDVPVVCAIDGGCAGAGFVVATWTDIRIVAHDARIATAFARLGLPAEYGTGWWLPRIMGSANAMLILCDGAPRSGDEMARLGWAQHAVDDATATARELVRRMARESSPQALRTMKRAVTRDAHGDLEDAYVRSVRDMDAAMRHPDFHEGVHAIRQRRSPDFLRDAAEGADRPRR